MDIILNIVTPVFGLLLLGFGAARLRWFDNAAARGLSLFVFNFAMPPLLFRSMATAELPARAPWNLLLAYYLAAFAVFALGMATAKLGFARRLGEQGVFGFSAAFSNAVLMGIPLVLTALGQDASLPLFLLLAFHSLLMIPVATVIIEVGRGHRAALHNIPANTAKGLAQNPIIVAMVLGLGFNLLGFTIPTPIDNIAKTLGQAGPPCALFALGASLSQYRIAGNLPEALSLVFLKNLAHPLLAWLLAVYVFALPPLWTKVAVLIAALPTGVNAYLFAQRYEIGIDTATTTIFLSTAASLLSLSALLFLLDVR